MDYADILKTFETLRIELEYAIADFKDLRTELENAIEELENKSARGNPPVKVADFVEARSKRLLAQQGLKPAGKREPTAGAPATLAVFTPTPDQGG